MISRDRDRSSWLTSSRGSSQLVIMLAALVVVIFLMFYLQRLGSDDTAGQPRNRSLKTGRLRYSNPRLGFSIKAPSEAWTIQEIVVPDSLGGHDELSSIRERTTGVVRLSYHDGHEVSARAEVGVLTFGEPRSAASIATESLEQIMATRRSPEDSINLVLAVSRVESYVLDGAYFVVEVPPDRRDPEPRLNVWIMTYIRGKQKVFEIRCQTSRSQYARHRDDLAKIIESFRLTG